MQSLDFEMLASSKEEALSKGSAANLAAQAMPRLNRERLNLVLAKGISALKQV